MGAYSPEPPRKYCVLHHPFDYHEGDRVIDMSPQKNDGSVVGDVTFGHTGVIGQAARMESDDADVVVDAVTQHYPAKSTTVSGWSRSERPIPSSEANVQADVTVQGTNYQLSHNVAENVSSWQFAAVDYDGSIARLYYSRLGGDLQLVDTVDISGGDVEDVTLEFNTNGHGYVDDVRMYVRSVRSHISGLYAIGNEHQSLDEFGEAWDNPGIPLRGNNLDFGGALGEEDDQILRQLDFVTESHHIDDANGEQLDRLGEAAGVRRKETESDARYRARIKATMAAGRSSGTFEDIITAVAVILETSTDEIEVQQQFDTDPATAFVYVRGSALDESPLTAGDVTTIVKDVVLAGHDIEVIEQGANPFTVIDDTMVNDPEKGLTSDSISTGGGLVSDI